MLAGKWLKIHVGVSSLKISTTLILLHAIFLWGFKSAPFKNVYLLHDFAIRIKENDKFEEYSIIKHYKTTTMSCNKNQIAYRYIRYTFLSNHNIHKSWCGFCFLASDPLIERF